MVAKESTQKNEAPFRFLRADEFAKLTQQERITYLEQAIHAVTSGRPLIDGLSDKDHQ